MFTCIYNIFLEVAVSVPKMMWKTDIFMVKWVVFCSRLSLSRWSYYDFCLCLWAQSSCTYSEKHSVSSRRQISYKILNEAVEKKINIFKLHAGSKLNELPLDVNVVQIFNVEDVLSDTLHVSINLQAPLCYRHTKIRKAFSYKYDQLSYQRRSSYWVTRMKRSSWVSWEQLQQHIPPFSSGCQYEVCLLVCLCRCSLTLPLAVAFCWSFVIAWRQGQWSSLHAKSVWDFRQWVSCLYAPILLCSIKEIYR